MEQFPTVDEIARRAAAAGVSIRQVFARAGSAFQTYYRWRSGQYEPKVRVLRSVREALEGFEREAHYSRERDRRDEVPQESDQ